MKTRRIALVSILGVLITAASSPLSAQKMPDVKAGDEVRIYDAERLIIQGRFQSIENYISFYG